MDRVKNVKRGYEKAYPTSNKFSNSVITNNLSTFLFGKDSNL